MNLLKFRIKYYKSIVDTGDCYFSEKLTILAGKNESGKTSILEALADFHEDKSIGDEAKPINGAGLPEVHVTFELDADELESIYNEAKLSFDKLESCQLTLIKRYGDKSYNLDSTSLEALHLTATKKSFSDYVDGTIARQKITTTIPKLSSQQPNEYKAEIQAVIAQVASEDEKTKLNALIEEIDKYVEENSRVGAFIDAFVSGSLPYFILFSSFDDVFPDSIPISELESSDWASDLEEVSSFKRSLISSSVKQDRRNHQTTVNGEFDDKFKEYWTQDDITLHVEKDGEEINFWIVEKDGGEYKPSQRSKGQQWYLSFYIKIVARMSENKPNILLIDEPGLYLHAKAQKDLLRVLQSHTTDYPVVFSTHSPYLITEDNLENIRLVEKDKKGTLILGKLHSHAQANKETLTPILTAIGLGLNDSITNVDQKNNVIVEGPEDVFYLQAFKLIAEKGVAPNVNFVNGGGAPNMGIVGSILEGWGCNVFYLYDKDQGKRDGEKHLKRTWKVLPEHIKSVLQQDDGNIVDIFSKDDFKSQVLGDEKLKFTSKNSDYVKTKKLDKVLLARKFLQRCQLDEVKVDDDTQTAIAALFKEIEFK